ncbi:diguanylate cyclase/phosphodiesterase [Malaciobacter halophilus]|nr:bifunctional diguanylate cyclase/phosphodiesterase [Malaciobacter halophilus]AXH08763.1 diguanylate cyclase/phosphodiesterase [Malaciobacter halophilus]
MKNNLITNKVLIFRILIVVLFFSIITLLIATIYIKRTALTTLAEDDAKKTSELIFETMYTRMQEGWAKEDLVKILNRMEHIRHGLEVHSYRNKNVEKIMGVIKEDKQKVKNDPLIQKAMEGKKQFVVQEDGSIRYLYPMKTSSECITCHYNSKVGDVNGVLDIKYPPNEIKISLDMVIYYFLIFFMLFIILYFYIFYKIINKKIIEPVVNFTEEIKKVTKDKSFTKRAHIKTKTAEIYSLQSRFNRLLDTITYYYNQLLNNLYTDSLTKIPNLTKLQEDIKLYKTQSLAVVSLDSFKTINSFYGVKVGDFIMNEVAKLLVKTSKDVGKVYRLHSDEFAIFSYETINIDFCEHLIKTISSKLFKYEDIDINIQATIGVAKDSKSRTLEKAILAVRTAKKEKRNIEIYNEELTLKEEYKNHIKLTSLLKHALQNDELTPFYQGLENTKTKKIDKYEALARVVKKDEIITPDRFLEISKSSKQYPKITEAMIRKSFEYFKNKKELSFSINLSMDDIKNEKTTSYLFEMIEKYNINERLTIELLESEELNHFEIIDKFIKRLKKYQVQIAIDDFGSGYSNFAYIIKLDIDYLKIDSSLIENIHKDKQALKIVKSIISFAKQLDIKVVAEKVHNQEIYNILTDLKVDYLQGYYISKPKPTI